MAAVIVAIVLTLLPVVGSAAPDASTTVTLIAVSDYHSHAMPFYSEGQADQAGIARAIAYLKRAKAHPNTLVISGGDTMHAETPAWSDEYRCLEWPWLNGLVDMMALGNHDLDYGWDVFLRCRDGAHYPILSADLVNSAGVPLLQVDGRPYVVKRIGDVKLGFFALGGPDVQRLIRKDDLPPGSTWTDALSTARRVVDELRRGEHVQAVVFIGHQLHEEDEAMARAVPGIALILGTHSHEKRALTTIPGSSTRYISPFQYLTYLSRVQLTFEGEALAAIEGTLVRMDAAQPEDAATAAEVARLQQALMTKRPERFRVLGHMPYELSDTNVSSSETLIGNWATERLRRAAGTHLFVATASSFRAALPPGDITAEAFYTAMPYRNRIVVAEMTGQQVADLVAISVGKRGSGDFSQQSGLHYAVRDGKPTAIRVRREPDSLDDTDVPLDPQATYKVGTTDFQAYATESYRTLFARAPHIAATPQTTDTVLMEAIKAGAITARLDGRSGAAP